MISRLLHSVTPWLLALLIGLAVYSHMQAQRYATQRDAAIDRAARAEARADALVRSVEWQREQIVILNNVLEVRDRQIDAITANSRAQREALTTLERDDAPSRDWSSEPLPDGIRGWVQQLTGDRDSGGDPDA